MFPWKCTSRLLPLHLAHLLEGTVVERRSAGEKKLKKRRRVKEPKEDEVRRYAHNPNRFSLKRATFISVSTACYPVDE